MITSHRISGPGQPHGKYLSSSSLNATQSEVKDQFWMLDRTQGSVAREKCEASRNGLRNMIGTGDQEIRGRRCTVTQLIAFGVAASSAFRVPSADQSRTNTSRPLFMKHKYLLEPPDSSYFFQSTNLHQVYPLTVFHNASPETTSWSASYKGNTISLY